MDGNTSDPEKKLNVAIVGAGLGGLVLAHALKLKGVEATIYERDSSPEGREQGYIIGLNQDGLNSLDRIMFPALREFLGKDQHINGFTVADEQLDVLFYANQLNSGRSCAINRARLRQLLAEEGPPLNIFWNKRLKSYKEDAEKVELHFEDGSSAIADIVVGADGSHSVVRKLRCPDWRQDNIDVVNIAGISPFPNKNEYPKLNNLVNTSMARIMSRQGSSILVMPWVVPAKQQRRLIWVVTAPASIPGAAAATTGLPQEAFEFCCAQVRNGHYHDELQRLIPQSDPNDMIRNDNLQSTVFHRPNLLGKTTRVTLLGDAAHTMTSHRGLGANTAFMDAIDLADALSAPDWQAQQQQYEHKLMKRGKTNVEGSLQSTRMLTMTGFFNVLIRNTIMRIIGFFLWVRRLF